MGYNQCMDENAQSRQPAMTEENGYRSSNAASSEATFVYVGLALLTVIAMAFGWPHFGGFRAVISLATLTAGLVAGFVVPLRFCGHLHGFGTGMLIGGLPAALGGMQVAYLVAAWCEHLGSFLIPIGLLLGAFLGSCILSTITGMIGVLIARLFFGRKLK